MAVINANGESSAKVRSDLCDAGSFDYTYMYIPEGKKNATCTRFENTAVFHGQLSNFRTLLEYY